MRPLQQLRVGIGIGTPRVIARAIKPLESLACGRAVTVYPIMNAIQPGLTGGDLNLLPHSIAVDVTAQPSISGPIAQAARHGPQRFD